MERDYTRFQRDGWTRVAHKYEDAWAGLTRLFIPDLLDAANITRGQRVLDVACGPGYVAEGARDRGATLTGVDISPEMIRIARERKRGACCGRRECWRSPSGRVPRRVPAHGCRTAQSVRMRI
jgi:2-polyprenyl-3-methyl-5-hydroxy-6-metoxy-1,4-benzoquinol methylase